MFSIPVHVFRETSLHVSIDSVWDGERVVFMYLTRLLNCRLNCCPVLFDLMMALQAIETHIITLKSLALFRPKPSNS